MPVPDQVLVLIPRRVTVPHRAKYMEIWDLAQKAGLSCSESRLYAELEIERMVKAGELAADGSNQSLGLNPPANQDDKPLPPNPPEAPIKIKTDKPKRPSLNLPFLKTKEQAMSDKELAQMYSDYGWGD